MTLDVTPIFRVHFSDGETMDITCDHPDDAREIAKERRRDGQIVKVKLIRDTDN